MVDSKKMIEQQEMQMALWGSICIAAGRDGGPRHTVMQDLVKYNVIK